MGRRTSFYPRLRRVSPVGTSDGGRIGLMESVWLGLVAILGTLVGSLTTHLLQRMNLRASSAQTLRNTWRADLREAVANYAMAVSDLRRAEFNRGRLRVGSAGNPEREAARQETYRLRTEARTAYVRMRLLADRQVDGAMLQRAEECIDLCQLITAESRNAAELRERSDAVTQALDDVLNAASDRVQASQSHI